MRSSTEMTPHTTDGHEGNFAFLVKIVFVWMAQFVSQFINSMTAEKFATYIAIVYTTVMLVTKIRDEIRAYRKRRTTCEVQEN